MTADSPSHAERFEKDARQQRTGCGLAFDAQ